MAERVTDLQRHRAPRRRAPGRRAGARRRRARGAVRAGRRGPRAGRHRRARPATRARPGDRARRPDQPHRDHRPPARHPVRGGRRRRDDDRGRHAAAGRRRRRHHRDRARRGRGRRRGWPPTRSARSALASWAGPGATADGVPVKILANVADGESARAAGDGAGAGRRAVPHRAVLPQPPGRAVGRGAGRRSTARCSTAFGDDRYVVVRTLDAGSDKPVAFATHEGEENPALGVRGLRLSFDNPGLLDRQLEGDRRGRDGDRHRDLGDGADGGDRRRGRGVRRQGARARAEGRA